MDMPNNNSAQGPAGNVAVPEWMLKRRAKQQAQTGSNTAVEDAVPSQPAPWVPPPANEVTGPSKSIEVRAKEPVPVVPRREVSAATSPDVSPLEFNPTPPVSRRVNATESPVPVPSSMPWWDEIRNRWLNPANRNSLLVSFSIHLLCGLTLSLIVIHKQMPSLGFNAVMMGEGEGEGGEGLDDSMLQIDPGGLTGPPLDSLLSADAMTSTTGSSSLNLPEGLGGLKVGGGGDGEGQGDGVGDGLNVGGFKMPAGGKAVKKGSFTAWTVPEDPKPGEDYKIIIQVKYKLRNQKLTPTDITGSVIGTDQYRLMISQYTSEIIPEANQVVVHIPGASARVRDTIRVYSALLKENQRLEIVF